MQSNQKESEDPHINDKLNHLLRSRI